MRHSGKICLILLWALISSGCAIDPHENFVRLMHSQVGKKIHRTDPGFASEERLIEVRTLENGNLEYQYASYRTCTYFFEVHPESSIILSFRFEGNEDDCVITP